jgi:hypothetical protein
MLSGKRDTCLEARKRLYYGAFFMNLYFQISPLASHRCLNGIAGNFPVMDQRQMLTYANQRN